jgi:uncharacterized protein
MSDAGVTRLGPVTGMARIEVLDVLRGIAILGIFYMNIPFQAFNATLLQLDIRSPGWSIADRNTWAAIEIFWEGTQRGLLEFLFGAGMMVLTARAMAPDGPVAVADLYIRRNLWLLVFGLADVFLILWVGDILHIYALAALFLFPFRKVSPKLLVALGLVWATWIGIGHPKNAIFPKGSGAFEYVARSELQENVAAARAKQAAATPLTTADKAALAAWQKKVDGLKVSTEMQAEAAKEDKAHRGGLIELGTLNWSTWLFLQGKGFSFHGVLEAFSAMLIGIALWKWRIIQGGRSARFYAVMALLAYGFGLTARAVGVAEIFTFQPIPKTIWITQEYARLAVSLGHLALVNLIVKAAIGRTILSPFKAAGRTAFSLYFLTQIIGIWFLFAPWGPGLWRQYSYAGVTVIATIVIAVLLVVANIWVRYFAIGPLEWAWRSLSYNKRQPFLHRRAVPDPLVV